MDLVMFHSGELPSYLNCTFRQIRTFNPVINIYFITDSQNINDPIFNLYDVITFNKDHYHSSDITEFEKLFNRSSSDFWTITATRLFYIKNFIKAHALTDVYHFENDVLLYYDISKLHDTFLKLYDSLAITTGGEDKCMTGFMFIKEFSALEQMTEFFIFQLKTYGVKGLKKTYYMDMVNEMTLMRAYTKMFNNMCPLPTIPFGSQSMNFEEFNSIFDPASWGQFVGGTTNGIPGAKPDDHYIGKLLQAYPDYTVNFWEDEQERKVPFFEYDNKKVKINNLHIHSKNLQKYMSCQPIY